MGEGNAMIKINTVDMPTPSKLYVVLLNVQSPDDRNAAGTTIIDRIATKRRLECEWAYLSPTDMATLLAAVSATVFFTVNYYDPYDNALKDITCHVGERAVGVYREISGVPMWVNTKMTLMER
jgi:hypothetical protein